MRKGSKIRTSLVIALAALTTMIWGTKKAVEFSVEPSGDKDCGFIYYRETDGTKATQMEVTYEGEMINDASCLNQTPIYGVVTVKDSTDIFNALSFAKENDLKISLAGQQHSMGGQSFIRGGLILDMKGLTAMEMTESGTLSVQSGATWAEVQEFLDPMGLSVKAMQSINIFTVGGTLSVNAHGTAHNPGQVGATVRSLQVMLPSGEIVTASLTENEDLFRHTLGGYGLFGIILSAELEVVPNIMLNHEIEYMDYKDFPAYYEANIEGDEESELFFARLSVSPFSYLTETVVHDLKRTDFEGELPPMQPEEHTTFKRFVLNFSKTGNLGRWFRWILEKHVDAYQLPCTRNTAMSQAEQICLSSRNQNMYDPRAYLKTNVPSTDILQEYFLPHEHFVEFIDGLREVVKKNDANLLNATIRIVNKDEISALPYAKGDRFAVVLYFNQKLSEKDSETLEKTTLDLIDLAESLDGTFYLPYQLYYSKEQLQLAYPEIDDFFAEKLEMDPEEILSNKWYEKYKQ
ncbi:FAD-binding oxidoreductase [Candidatus Peregrinibacteria bacterium]|nr:MAG: FAD-binding oxidoreductase [Candidatus Peregrinibacteria bacterium]